MTRLRKATLVSLISFLLCFSSVPVGRTISAPFVPPFGTLNVFGSLALSASGGNYNIDFFPGGGTTGDFTVGFGATGTFMGLTGTGGFIKDLNQASQPVGVPFLLTNFLTLGALPTVQFNLTMINPGLFSPAQCGLPPAAGQFCSLPGSQYNFTNVTASSSTVSFTVSGNAVDAGMSSPFVGVITAQFADKSLQSVLATIAGGGSVQTTFSASFAVTPPQAPSFSKDEEGAIESANNQSPKLRLSPDAAPVGNLNICGSLALSASAGNYNIDFLPPGGAPNGDFTVGFGATGTFAGLPGTHGFIKDLNQASQPVGVPILLTNFLTLGALPTLQFSLTMINPGLFSSAQCGLPPAAGQLCSLPGSQYNFTNVTASSSTLSFTVRGNAVDGAMSSQFVGVITAPFAGNSLQSVLATIAGGGSVQTTFSASFTITCPDLQPPTINCPGNVVADTDTNRCDALVNYTPPSVSDDCTLFTQPTCTPASGTVFPKGTTTVNCQITDSAGNMATCSFTVTVNDRQLPLITCPSDITIVTPGGLCTVVNYPPPTVTDNCPGVTVSCNPPSGTCFQLGTTTVTCTATDTSGNAASCTFTVTTFDICIQDDSNPTTVLLWNSQTGAYRFCCGGQTFAGTGTTRRQGSTFRLEAFPADRRIVAIDDEGVHRANGSLQSPPGTTICTIADRDTRNNTCQCP